MCGIAAILRYGPGAPPLSEGELLRVRDSMIHRGPDGAGLWISPDRTAGLAHRRLSIIDLSEAGAQPMANPDQSALITFNGEIFNYRALRKELEDKGFQFRSNSDTEVLLHLYADRGAEMVHSLRGMYTFAIWDARKRGMFLARDPFGIKPFYFADDGRTFVAASQVKAIECLDGLKYDPDPAGHVGFFLWGHVPEPFTLNRNVRSLDSGTSLWIDFTGKRVERRFFSVRDELVSAAGKPIPERDRQELVRDMLKDSVRSHMVADVPVGVFLSAGLDSTTIAGLASEVSGASLRTITLGFNEFRGTAADEVPLAEVVAAHYGTRHETDWISKSDFDGEFDRVLAHMDLPSIDGVNTYFVSRAAARAGLKVALSGLGGDEFFGGYPSFRQIPRITAATAPFRRMPALARVLRRAMAAPARTMTSPKYAGVVEYGTSVERAYLLRRALHMPWEIGDLFEQAFATEGLERLETIARLRADIDGLAREYPQIVALESSWYMRNQLLRDTDWASMAHSLEVRVPLVDVTLFRALAPLLVSAKPPSKREMAGTPHPPLPAQVLDRAKTGFTTPVRQWIFGRASSDSSARGLRGWANLVYRNATSEHKNPSWRSGPVAMVFRTGQLGDTLMALPAIQVLKKRFPEHRFVLLTDAQRQGSGHVSAWDILGPTGWFSGRTFYNPRATGLEVWNEWSTLLLRLRRQRIDRFINLAAGRSTGQRLRDWVCFGLIAAPRVYHPPTRERAPASRDGRLPSMSSEWQYALDGLEATRGEVSDFAFPITQSAREEAVAMARDMGVNFEGRTLAVGPGSKMAAKIWPSSRFEALGNELLQRYPDLQLVVVGSAQDAPLGANLCKAWGERSFNLAGRLSVEGSAAVLAECDGYVGNDTGAMHLAAMVGTPCAAIFSARDYPGRWDPFGSGHIVLRKEVPCAGCLLEVCEQKQNLCLNLIEVDEVLDATVRILH